ncbi:MAG: hypothetical protein M1825_003558 [Sarcosagium campestre]|nr:MAG: hypothetical protein M1825_003558 [Sarcosagium campestre]
MTLGVVLGALFLAVAVVRYTLAVGTIRRNGKRLPRPPNTLPILGNALCFLRPRHELLQWFTQRGHQFGLESYEISVPSLPPGIVISDPKNLEYVLSRDDLFDKGDFFRRRSWDLFGNGIINADGPLWKAQRKAGLHFFRASNLKTLVDDVLPEFLRKTLSTLREAEHASTITDLDFVFLDLTTRLMGRVAYDMDMEADSSFSSAFDLASGATGERFQNPLWRITEVFQGSRFRAAIREVKLFGHNIVDAATQSGKGGLLDSPAASREANHPRPLSSKMQGSLINSLMAEIGNPEIVADAALNFLSAGRDTLAQSLTWTFYLLMRHPNIVEAVRAEIDSASPTVEKNLTFDAVQPVQLPYIRAVFNEALRLYPPVPFEIKQCRATTTLPDGTTLPQGAIVLWCSWAMGRSRLLWGDDSDVFRPERWIEHDGEMEGSKPRLKTRTQFEFPVFNGGTRTCLGRRMAETLAVYIIASLVREFDFVEEVGFRAGYASVKLLLDLDPDFQRRLNKMMILVPASEEYLSWPCVLGISPSNANDDQKVLM